MLVIVWHFTHGRSGSPVPFEYVPSLFPFALLDEGHTGVALFMTLSGYLFAKLIGDQHLRYGAFLWNRCLRLLPLLFVVIAIVGVQMTLQGHSLSDYAASIAWGAIYPSLPNGGWSITAEFHAYLILPLLLGLRRRARWLPLVLVGFALLVRVACYSWTGEVQMLAYGSIVGRLDQFVLGITVYGYRKIFTGQHKLAATAVSLLALLYWGFDILGGFYGIPASSPFSALWLLIPTIEGLVYAVLIAWYDQSFQPQNKGLSKLIGQIGAYSYSIYLFHFFVVFSAADYVHEHIMRIDNFYLATCWAVVFLLVMLPFAYLSYRFIEAPFLKLRRPYLSA